MSTGSANRRVARYKRKQRIRNNVSGTVARPRLSVFRSARHVYAQVIDDISGNTLVSVGTQSKKNMDKRADMETCTSLGKSLAEKCKEKKIDKVVFDKNGYAYHGRIKAFADGAREAGLSF
jgi:large subunit ribosomal protein L18